jgi:ribosomal protein S18 acetylase RimI-like enzyme
VDDLFDAATAWCRERGFPEVVLDVHRDNARAQGAYRRAGFAPSGVAFTSAIGPEIEMVRTLR